MSPLLLLLGAALGAVRYRYRRRRPQLLRGSGSTRPTNGTDFRRWIR